MMDSIEYRLAREHQLQNEANAARQRRIAEAEGSGASETAQQPSLFGVAIQVWRRVLFTRRPCWRQDYMHLLWRISVDMVREARPGW